MYHPPCRQQSAPSAVPALVQQTHMQHVTPTFTVDEQSLLNSNLERFYSELTKIREEMHLVSKNIEEMRVKFKFHLMTPTCCES